MKVLKGYNSAASAKRRLLAVVGRDEVLIKPVGGKDEKEKVMLSGNTRAGYDGKFGVFYALSLASIRKW